MWQVHWDTKATTLREHLQAIAGADADELALAKLNTRAERLRYMQLHTLGCPDTFEFRRQEIGLLESRDPAGVTDDEVVANFLFDINDEQGALRQYLSHGTAAAVIGNTLIVHGAVDANTMGVVPQHTRFELPTEKTPAARTDLPVAEWADAMNAYLAAGMQDHADRPDWDAKRETRGGESLMALQNRCAMWGRSIVSNCYADGGNITTPQAESKREQAWARAETDPLAYEGVSSNPRDVSVAQWLRAGGIRRVITGHKPAGDSPAICASAYTGVEVITADTSFSDTSKPDNRGAAIACVLVQGESSTANHTEIAGTLRDGRQYTGRLATLGGDEDGRISLFILKLPVVLLGLLVQQLRDRLVLHPPPEPYNLHGPGWLCLRTGTGGDPVIGTDEEDSEGGAWWYKAQVGSECVGGGTSVRSGATYLQCRGSGRKVEYRDVQLFSPKRKRAPM